MRFDGRRVCALALSLCLVFSPSVRAGATEAGSGQEKLPEAVISDMPTLASATDLDAQQTKAGDARSDTVSVSLTGDAVAVVDTEACYVLSAGNMNKLATVTVWFEADGDYFSGKSVKGLEGFEVLDTIHWVEEEGSIWNGRVTMANFTGGVTSDQNVDILKLILSVKENTGTTEVRIDRLELSGYGEDGKAVYFEADIGNDAVTTEVIPYFSPYDLNRDGRVNQLDLTTAQFYYKAAEGDEGWEEAKIADLNADGRVDIEDLILILLRVDWGEITVAESLLIVFEEESVPLTDLPDEIDPDGFREERPEEELPENQENANPGTENPPENQENANPGTENPPENQENANPGTENPPENQENANPGTENPPENQQSADPGTEGSSGNHEGEGHGADIAEMI